MSTPVPGSTTKRSKRGRGRVPKHHVDATEIPAPQSSSAAPATVPMRPPTVEHATAPALDLTRAEHQRDQRRAVALMATRDPLSDPDPKYLYSGESAHAGDVIAKEFGIGFDGDLAYLEATPRHAEPAPWTTKEAK